MTTTNAGASNGLPRPPEWAEMVLRMLLRPDDAETVSGDLLEEYRENVVPAIGRGRANVWYIRQLLGFMWRSAWAWALLLGVFLGGRVVFDTFAPPANLVSGWGPRSAFTTWSSIVLYVSAGVWSAWRTGRARSGLLVAMITHVGGSTLGAGCSIALFVSVIRHDPMMLNLFHVTGGWGETWGLPVMLVPIVLTLGTLGGMMGRLLGALTRRQTAG